MFVCSHFIACCVDAIVVLLFHYFIDASLLCFSSHFDTLSRRQTSHHQVSGPDIKAYVRILLKEYGLQEPDSSVFHGVGVKSGGRGTGSPVPPASILAAASSTVHSFSDANENTAEDRSAENDTGAEVYSL